MFFIENQSSDWFFHLESRFSCIFQCKNVFFHQNLCFLWKISMKIIFFIVFLQKSWFPHSVLMKNHLFLTSILWKQCFFNEIAFFSLDFTWNLVFYKDFSLNMTFAWGKSYKIIIFSHPFNTKKQSFIESMKGTSASCIFIKSFHVFMCRLWNLNELLDFFLETQMLSWDFK